MKKFHFLFIFCCFCLFVINYGCEKADLQKSTPNDTVQIEPRGDCLDCPGANSCCCFIEYVSGDAGKFSLCGTTSGDAVSCEIDPSPCGYEVDGLQHTSFDLNSFNPIQYFCVDENTAFQIYRYLSPNGTTLVRYGCQRSSLSGQIIYESFTDEERILYDVNGACELEPCD